jgi:sugar lactone lactonase YvrE
MAAVVTATAGLLAASGILATSANASTDSFIGGLNTITPIASTVPAVNGDVNPYGVAVVPSSTGDLHRGNVLVSNFNNLATQANPTGLQGLGTTIVQVSPGGAVSLFAHINPKLRGCPGGVGLTTALVVLRSGWVIVGSLPTTDGTSATLGSGCLIVLDSHGNVRETLAGHGINGPWDMTALDLGALSELFVTNVLNGIVGPNGASAATEGTVLRLLITSGPFGLPRLLAVTQIGSGFAEHTDPNALIVGPTGVGLGRNGTLYVADTVNSTIDAIPNAVFRLSDDGTGTPVATGPPLNGPLGLAIAPNGDILTVNGGDGMIVETTPDGHLAASRVIDVSTPGGAGGDLFGLAVRPDGGAVYFVNDGNNMLYLLS